MRRIILVFGSFALLALPIQSVMAEDNGWYVGGSIGKTDVGINCTSGACNDSDTALRIFGGYQITKIWGVQAAVMDLGQIEAGFGTGFTSTAVEFAGADILGTATWNIADHWAVFVELGFYTISADVKGGISTRGEDWTGGFGGAWKANEHHAIRVEYQSWNAVGDSATTGEADIALYSAGYVFSF